MAIRFLSEQSGYAFNFSGFALTHDSKQPRAFDLPSAVMTQGRLLQGG